MLSRDDRPGDRSVALGGADPPAVPRRGSRLRGVAPADPERARRRTADELVMGPGESKAVGRGGCYSKIKLHLTCSGSQHHLGGSREARPFRGTSWFPDRRAARPVSLSVQPNVRPGCRRRANGGRTPRRDPCPRPAREFLRKHTARAVSHPPRKPQCQHVGGGLRGPQAAVLASARGYLRLGPCVRGLQRRRQACRGSCPRCDGVRIRAVTVSA